MTDTELARALERREVTNKGFDHAAHLRVGWVYLRESPSIEEACRKMSAALGRFAASVGHPEKYHETITQFWMRCLAQLRASMPGRDLRAILQANPWLLEKNSLLEYYAPDTLFSDHARTTWVEPDLKPISIDASALCSSRSPRDA